MYYYNSYNKRYNSKFTEYLFKMNTNEQILHFELYKSDEDIIKSSNYLFTQDINVLLSNSINS